MKTKALAHYIFFTFSLLCYSTMLFSQSTFKNPLLPSGADPFSTYHKGYYYYTHTVQNKLVLWKTKNLENLATAEKKVIWTPPENTKYSKEIWAPEFHFINGKWYCYFAADDGNNNNHRMYVLENTSEDPFKGKNSRLAR